MVVAMIREGAGAPRRDRDGAAVLRRVIDMIDRDLVWPLTGELGLDATDACPVFLAVDQPLIQTGSVVLGVGLEPRGKATIDVIRQCGAAKASALALKLPPGVEPDPATITAAEQSGVALLAVRPDLAWGQLFILLRTAVARTGGLLAAADVAVPAGDLFGLAHAIADSVGGAVTIEDPRFNVLAYSSLDEPVDELRLQAILTRRTSDEWIRRLADAGAIAALTTSPGVIRVDALTQWGLQPRLAIAVRAGQEFLGSIWVAEGKRPLGSAAETALESAAASASLHLLRHRASEDLERSANSRLLESLLDGSGSAELVARRLGLDVNGDFTVVAFDLQPGDESDVAARRERVLHLVSRYWEAFRRPAVCTATAGAVYALLPGGATLPRPRLLAACEGVVEHISSALRLPVWAGIGSTVHGLEAAPEARREADQVLQTLGRNATGPHVADIETARTKVFLLEMQRVFARRPDLMAGKLQKLIEHDRLHNTSYVDSVAAYLDAFGDVSLAAQAVVVHSKTFRYRLRRIRELSGLDFGDPHDRLVAHLQLRALRAHGP